MSIIFRFIPVFLFSVCFLNAKPSGHILRDLEKIKTLGSILYFAAHPDDENTALLAYLSQHESLDAAYLSLTRGSGGQNRIGSELNAGLGIIRTQELLTARRIDGARQYFSNAIDFGYSRSQSETLRIWGESDVLGDAVKVIREYKPDVIIIRFHPGDSQTHGHHQAATYLALQAFELAGDPAAYPEQLEYLEPHQASRLYWDAYWWTDRYQDEIDQPGTLSFELSSFDPILGESYTEISRRALGQHKSQGVVFPLSREKMPIKLVLVKGEPVDELFAETDISWNRIDPSGTITAILDEAVLHYDLRNPEAIVPLLLDARREIENLKTSVWKSRKLPALDQIILDCLGIFVDARISTSQVYQGEIASIEVEIANRSNRDLSFDLKAMNAFVPAQWPERLQIMSAHENNSWELLAGVQQTFKLEIEIPENVPATTPYWLVVPGVYGRYGVESPQLTGLSQNPPTLELRLEVVIDEQRVYGSFPVVYRSVDSMRGESRDPVAITEPISISLPDTLLISANEQILDIPLVLTSNQTETISGILKIESSDEWNRESVEVPLQIEGYQRLTHMLELQPKKNASRGVLEVKFIAEGKTYRQSRSQIKYPHIPTQVIHTPASKKLIHVSVKGVDNKIGYFHGAGDKIPQTLQSLGFHVDVLSYEQLGDIQTLSQYDAVIYGMRAYNTHSELEEVESVLTQYVKQGGTWIVQSIDPRRMKSQFHPPIPLTTGRSSRVTDEAATIRFLLPTHKVLHTPNEITDADFEGWVQERGLYFAESWDDAYASILSCNDPDFPPEDGGLLISQHEEGYFVYTGYAFFRQIPAGNSGAIKLFSNLVSL